MEMKKTAMNTIKVDMCGTSLWSYTIYQINFDSLMNRFANKIIVFVYGFEVETWILRDRYARLFDFFFSKIERIENSTDHLQRNSNRIDDEFGRFRIKTI